MKLYVYLIFGSLILSACHEPLVDYYSEYILFFENKTDKDITLYNIHDLDTLEIKSTQIVDVYTDHWDTKAPPPLEMIYDYPPFRLNILDLDSEYADQLCVRFAVDNQSVVITDTIFFCDMRQYRVEQTRSNSYNLFYTFTDEIVEKILSLNKKEENEQTSE